MTTKPAQASRWSIVWRTVGPVWAALRQARQRAGYRPWHLLRVTATAERTHHTATAPLPRAASMIPARPPVSSLIRPYTVYTNHEVIRTANAQTKTRRNHMSTN